MITHQLSQVEELKKLLVKQKEQMFSTGNSQKLIAAWDLDGTIIKGDITEGYHKSSKDDYQGLMESLVLEGTFPEFSGKDGLELFWQQYKKQDSSKALLFVAEFFDHMDEQTTKYVCQFCQDLIENELHRYYYPQAIDLLYYLEDLGVENYIISASPHMIVQQVHSSLPIKKENLWGIDAARLQTDPGYFLNYGEGKKSNLLSILKREKAHLFFSAGNDWVSDGPMIRLACEHGGVGLFVGEEEKSLASHHEESLVKIRFN